LSEECPRKWFDSGWHPKSVAAAVAAIIERSNVARKEVKSLEKNCCIPEKLDWKAIHTDRLWNYLNEPHQKELLQDYQQATRDHQPKLDDAGNLLDVGSMLTQRLAANFGKDRRFLRAFWGQVAFRIMDSVGVKD
jgi:hypothetical protein